MNQSDIPNFTADELGQRWGGLLNNALISVITLEKENHRLQVENAKLLAEIERLGEIKKPPEGG
jgi:hypothetical protein